MRRILTRVSLLSFVIAIAVAVHAQVTIGVVLSLTGPASSLGIPEQNVVKLGPSTIAGEKVRYIILDDASDPTTAVQDVKRLTSEDHADVLLGPSTSSSSLAVIEEVADSHTPLISIASASEIVEPMDAERKWVFKAPANDILFAHVEVAHMKEHGVKTVSIIAVNDAYGEAHGGALKKVADTDGIKILTVEKFQRSETSVTAEALRAMKGNPDAIYIAAAGTLAVVPQLAVVKLGYRGIIYESSGSVDAKFLSLGGKDVEGTYFSTMPNIVPEQLPNNYPTKEEGLYFNKLYESQYGTRTTFIANAWDALKLIQAAIPVALKSAKPGTPEFREATRNALENTKHLVGAAGVYTMTPTNHSGADPRGICMIRIVEGNWKLDECPAFK